LYGRLVVDGSGSHTFLDLASHGQKGLFDIGGVLGRGLEERDTQTVGKFLLPGKYGNHVINKDLLTLAMVYSTTFFSAISLLLPTSSLLTPSVA
jgi:hypothetical protein